jgi:hypothetical protein
MKWCDIYGNQIGWAFQSTNGKWVCFGLYYWNVYAEEIIYD